MARFALLSSLLRSLLVAGCALSMAQAQITNVSDDVSTPTPGVGHDYIQLLNETVNPANGSVNVGLTLPVPSGRGITLPFAYSYNSDGVHHLYPSPPWQPSWNGKVLGSVGGWSAAHAPQLSFDGGVQTTVQPDGQNSNCYYVDDFVFSDSAGVLIPFKAYAMDWMSNTNKPCGGGLAATSSIDGYSIVLITSGPPGCTPQPTCVSGLGPVSVQVTDPRGTVYSFGNVYLGGANVNDATSVEDRNGNMVTISGGSVTDSTGRTYAVGTVPGESYSVTYTTSPANFNVNSNQINPPPPNWACNWPSSVSNSQPVIQSIQLPNTQQFHFYYGTDNPNGFGNPYGLLSEVDYPSGLWVRYQWSMSPQMQDFINYDGYATGNGADEPGACFYQYQVPVVTLREVGFSGSSQPVLTQTFGYTTAWASSGTTWTNKATSVITTDVVRNLTSKTVYNYQPYTVYSGAPFLPVGSNYQIPLESSIQYYSPGGTSPIRTVTKSWTDQYEMASETTTLQDVTPSISSKTTYTYHAMGLPSEVDEYDYGQSSPTRKTVTNYQLFGNTPAFPFIPSILDRICQSIVYDSGGNRVAEADYFYDGSTTTIPCSTATTQTLLGSGTYTGHDETLYGTNASVPRGNLTKVVKQCFQGTQACSGGNPAQAYAFDETGQVTSFTDANNNTTHYSYTDHYSNGTPPASTNSYLTTITHPTVNSVISHEYYEYDYPTGLLTVSQDDNDLTNDTSTTYSYNDPSYRITQVSHADGGQTQFKYNDTPTSSSVTTCELISGSAGATCSPTSPPSGWKTKLVTKDGMGHVVQTQLVSDPDGVTYTASTFDGMGRIYQAYNPYRSTSDTTYGVTTYVYDTLGRVCVIGRPDGAALSPATGCPTTAPRGDVFTQYSGNQTTATDEVGNQRTSQTNALGQLTYVWEAPNRTGYNYETDYTYDALGNLTYVNQKGNNSSNARTRTFSYDSLSRLMSATNPESGTITYAYDANGNLSSKAAPLPNQGTSNLVTTNYTYDPLNRLTSKKYMDGVNPDPYTPTVKYGYDHVAPTGCTKAPPILPDSYAIGRRTSMCDGSGSTSWDHDPMGRIKQDMRFIGGITAAKFVNYGYNFDGSLAYLTTPPIKTLAYYYGTSTSAGRATQLLDTTDHITFVTGATYAPPGELASATVGGVTGFAGFAINNSYNSRLQPILLSASARGSTVFSECFDSHLGVAVNTPPCSFNASTAGDNGNVYQIVNNRAADRTQNFLYDPLNRIQQAYSSGPDWGETYSPVATAAGVAPTTLGIDSWGNLTNISGVMNKNNSEQLNCPAGSKNQLSTCGFSYDAAGNLTETGLNVSYVFDAENRIIATSGLSYIYDGDGNRVEKCTEGGLPGQCSTGATGTLYWRDTGGKVLDETDLSGNPQEEYIFFNGQRISRRDIDSNGNTIALHYYFSDHLGSHGVVENGNGTAVEQDIDYYPYGGVEYDYSAGGGVPQHYKFTGKERDSESGLDMFGARYYGSSLGRFMTPDWSSAATTVPYADFDNPQSLNLYSYTRNNPTTLRDPNGHCTKNGSVHGRLWCFFHYSDEDEQHDADEARANLLSMRGLQISGQPASVWVRTATNQQLISVQRSLVNLLAVQGPLEYLDDWMSGKSRVIPVVSSVAPILQPLTVDALGKIHDALPDHVPDGWSQDQLEEARDALRQSIKTRLDEAADFDGLDAAHMSRVRQEQQLLREVEGKLGSQ